MKIFLKAVVLILSIKSTLLSAQNTEGIGNWYILNARYNANEKWSFFVESQLRSLQFQNQFNYYEFKGGINFKPDKKYKVTLGGGSYQTFKEGGNFLKPKNNDEFRLWPQLILFQDLGKLKIEQRYRTELRFTSNGYRTRFRYRVGVSYPFGKDLHGYKPFVLSTSNELFFTNREPFFERNRLTLALNYKASKSSTLQLGYVHQYDYKINDEIGRDFIKLGYYIEIFNTKHDSKQVDDDIKDE